MGTRANGIAALLAVFFLTMAFGAAGVAFADEGAGLTAGRVAASEGHADGWENDGAAWRYWRGGEAVAGEWVVTSDGPSIAGDAGTARRYWIAQDGTLAVSRLIDPDAENDDGADYFAYATARGYVATGKTAVGDKVYLARGNGELESGNSLGMLYTKRYDNGDKRRYYIDPAEHAAVTGKAVKAKGFGWVYAYPKRGYLLTGVKKVDKTHVVLADKNGKMRHKGGWVTTRKYTGNSKQRYYIERTKKDKTLYGARIGSFKVGGKRYLGQSKGYVFRNGYKLVNGKYYRADNAGAITYNGVITQMYKKAQGYSSPSKYLIMVDVNDTKFMVFTGKKGNWKTKYIWDCSTGAPSTPTPIGVWHVGIKGYSFGHGYTCYYYTQFWGDYLIHTRIYQEGTHILRDAAMNTKVSQGCVRLYDEDAYWVYKNIPSGTTVVTIP